MDKIFEDFHWHSSIGIDDALGSDKKFVTRLKNTKKARMNFVTAGDDLLIHRATQALWRISEDGNCIEPVFGSDILTEDDLKNLEGEISNE